MKTYYRLGTVGEKKIFEDYPDKYHGIAVGANLAAFYPDWLPAFLRTVKKPFFIDPVTYIFARSLENIKKYSEIRPSFKNLAKAYSKGITDLIEKEGRQLIPRDFFTGGEWNNEFVEELVANVLSFQRMVMQAPSQLSLSEYAQILGEQVPEEVGGPEFLVAPYFYSSSLHDPWYEISLRVAKHGSTLRESLPLYAVVSISRELLLDSQVIRQICHDYGGFDGYLVWVSAFDEKKEGEEYLRGLIDFVEELSKKGKPIYTLYGEYFSAIISKFGLSGYSRGICYSASKNVDAAGGAAPLPQRYYIELNHGKLSEMVARTFFADNPEELCQCEVCGAAVSHLGQHGRAKVAAFFDRLDFAKAKAHFLVVHAKEREEITQGQLREIVRQLKISIDKCDELKAQFYNISDGHLHKWLDVLTKKLGG